MFNSLQYIADNGGCSFYRMRFPALAAQTMRKDVRSIESCKMVIDSRFYQDFRSVRVQRQVGPAQRQMFEQFLVPISKATGFWLSYEIDDVIYKDDIPPYNIGRDPYQDDSLMDNVKAMLNMCDFVTTTTPRIADYYAERFEVPRDQIEVIPNYLPRWWIGEMYQETQIEGRFEDNKAKPRIGFVSSSTHFDLQNRNGGVDDFTHITDFINSTVDKYQWVFIGGAPQQVAENIKNRKIELWPGSDILNYPRELGMKKLDIAVAPLQDNIFNRCKSPIKFLEMSAAGIPCICQDLDPYQGYTDLLFNDANDLQNQIDFVLSDKDKYLDLVKHNRHIIDYGDSMAPQGHWLEKNMSQWLSKVFMPPQKTIEMDLHSHLIKEMEAAAAAPELVFDTDLG